MKKRLNILILTVLLISLSLLPTLKADPSDPSDLSNVFGNNVSINPENLPQDFETIQRDYLQKEWEKKLAENKAIGPIHDFFTKISIVFKILIGYQYEISATFLLTLLLWIFTSYILYRIINSSEILKSWKAFFAALACSTILAQLKIQYYTAKYSLDLVFKKQGWVYSIVLTIIVLGFFAVIYITSGMLARELKKKAEKKKNKEKDIELKKVKEMTKEAQDIYDK
ncbi:MAG: hypothetical protein AABY10_00525 [Nanoarchaeota archaeon]